jgi:hypothetical protein
VPEKKSAVFLQCERQSFIPIKTKDQILDLYILAFTLLDTRQDDKKKRSAW